LEWRGREVDGGGGASGGVTSAPPDRAAVPTTSRRTRLDTATCSATARNSVAEKRGGSSALSPPAATERHADDDGDDDGNHQERRAGDDRGDSPPVRVPGLLALYEGDDAQDQGHALDEEEGDEEGQDERDDAHRLAREGRRHRWSPVGRGLIGRRTRGRQGGGGLRLGHGSPPPVDTACSERSGAPCRPSLDGNRTGPPGKGEGELGLGNDPRGTLAIGYTRKVAESHGLVLPLRLVA